MDLFYHRRHLPWSLPLVLTSIPTMICEAVSVLNWTL
jgi:hypothetical protein